MGPTAASTEIVVTGAREHNLKNVDVRIPIGSFTVVTGLSGSGKSSLAFDTLYAEGQRRYVESLSAYARQFLNQLQKPDVEHIEGLSPAIAIEQRTSGSNPRSIVATATEIHDYLRLLYANIGVRHCPACGKPVHRHTAQGITDKLMDLPEKTKLVLLAPLVRGTTGDHAELITATQRKGFLRLRVNGEIVDIDAVPKLAKRQGHDIDVVVDRISISSRGRTRLNDSVELALKEGNGTLIALPHGESDLVEQRYSEDYACADCHRSFGELEPRHFSFNSPYGACGRCAGLGTHLVFDEGLIVPNPTLSLAKGAVHAWKKGGRRLVAYFNGHLKSLCEHYKIDIKTPWSDLPESFREIMMHGSRDERIAFTVWRSGRHHSYTKSFEGVLPNLERRYAETKSEIMRGRLRAFMSRQVCPDCKGSRMKPESMACTVGAASIVTFTEMSISDAHAFMSALELSDHERQIVDEVVREITRRLGFMCEIGLGYLSLARESGTLSGGEAQRIRLATQIGAGLVGVLYVLDEPSIGLHQRDNERLIGTLQDLRDVGNTVVVVEHDEDTIRAADHIIDLGPGAGTHGGEIVAAGTLDSVLAAPNSLTAQYLNGERRIKVPRRRMKPFKGFITVEGATENNLKSVEVAFPLGLLMCVTGVSGSGKSTLVEDILSRRLFQHIYRSKDRPGAHTTVHGLEFVDKVVRIDQSPIGRTPRSNPATYTGAFTHIRKLLSELPDSRLRGYGPGRFSFNVKGGRCETCKGDGMLRLEMHFLPDVYVECEACRGHRYNEETLQIRFAGKNIAEILNMTIDDALAFFRSVPAINTRLRTMSDVGLGYLQLGQSATTLSGGEAQRVKLAAELAKRSTGSTVYLMDEPTTGLHFADVDRLLEVLFKLRESGNTIIIIEHNLDVIKCADYIVDLGPDGGDAGGQIVATGTPEEIAACPDSHTGRYLAPVLGTS